MDTGIVKAFRSAQKAREVAKRREREFREFCSGGTMVFAGLFLAVLYALLTHQITPR
jgi:hypothetical protein